MYLVSFLKEFQFVVIQTILYTLKKYVPKNVDKITSPKMDISINSLCIFNRLYEIRYSAKTCCEIKNLATNHTDQWEAVNIYWLNIREYNEFKRLDN